MHPIIAAIQMNSRSNVQANLNEAEKLIQQAAEAGAQLVALPEMFALLGAGETEKVKIAEKFGTGIIQDFLKDQAIKNKVWLVAGTIPIKTENAHKIRAACLIYDAQGHCVARYDKIHLFDAQVRPDIEVYQESKDTEAGEHVTVIDTPVGRIGVAVCYDIRFPELFRIMHKQGVEILIIPAAFTQKTGVVHWEVLMRARAIENFCYVIGSNQTGTHDNGRQTYGHSLIVHPWGNIISCKAQGSGIITAEIDLNELKQIRRNFPVHEHRCL